MGVKLIRVYDNRCWIVAEFEQDKAFIDSNGRPRRKFTLNASNLESRISNLERRGVDASVEREALSLIKIAEAEKK